MALSFTDKKAIAEVAGLLGTTPGSLEALLRFETAGTFNPRIKNPKSSARGLIQFIDATARQMGFKDSADLVDKFPTFEEQLRGPVYKYLRPSAPYKTDQALFMKVFYPAYMNKPVNTPFPEAVQKANPGIKTPFDYLQKVYRKARGAGGTAALLALSALGGIAFFFEALAA